MANVKDPFERQHIANLAAYVRMIDEIFRQATQEAASIGAMVQNIGFDESDLFSFEKYPYTKARIDRLMSGLAGGVQTTIVNGIKAEWTLANNKNSELARRVFGDNIGRLTQAQYRRYFSTNDAAREAFIARKEQGLNLSERVWNYANGFKSDMELGLDVGIRNGVPADEMSRELRQYLRHPDKLFRRVRDEHGDLVLSKRAQDFHPGQGVYRSSYMNARRLTATETNIAYRTAYYERAQQLDFIVGIEVKLSNNHNCKGVPAGMFYDICDELQGRYPKDFKFTGWHPFCRCHVETILKTEEELMAENRAILNGEDPSQESVNRVADVPQNFKEWLTENDGRMDKAKSMPYFLKDNPKYSGVQRRYGAVGVFTGTKLGRSATKAAFKAYENIPAPTLTDEVVNNTNEIARDLGIQGPVKPMTFLEANDGRANTNFGQGEEFNSNCQIAVAVHEARLRGLNVTSVGYDASEGSVSYILGEHFEQIWRHPNKEKTPAPTILRDQSFEAMVGKVEKATKATGRYHIGINMFDNRGHVITAERFADGRIIYYDAQSGVFLNIEEYAVSGVEYFEVLKVDKLLLRPDLFRQIARLL